VSRQRLIPHLNTVVITTAVVVTFVDAISKLVARHFLTQHAVQIVGPIRFRLQYNSGISFSLNQSGPLVTTVVTLLIAVIVLVLGVRAQPGTPAAGFGLLLGGGLANLVDRLAAAPHDVTDFIALGQFPIFNLADVAITAGFIVLFVSVLKGERLLKR
jgi:signal peptidase II